MGNFKKNDWVIAKIGKNDTYYNKFPYNVYVGQITSDDSEGYVNVNHKYFLQSKEIEGHTVIRHLKPNEVGISGNTLKLAEYPLYFDLDLEITTNPYQFETKRGVEVLYDVFTKILEKQVNRENNATFAYISTEMKLALNKCLKNAGLYDYVLLTKTTPSKKTFGSSEEYPICVDDEGNITSKQGKIKLGRLLSAIYRYIDSTEIEKVVSEWKKMHTIDTSIVKVSEKVGEIYSISRCGGSCMAKKPIEWFKIYEDMQSRIAYILNDEGNLRARALIHEVVDMETGEEFTVLDRIFYDDEAAKLTLQKWRKEQGGDNWTRIQFIKNRKIRGKYPIDTGYEGVPYVDNLSCVAEVDNRYYLSNHGNVDYLQETDGTSNSNYISTLIGEEHVYCVDSDEHIHIDDAYYCETDNEYYEYSDDLVYIEGWGYYHIDDENIAYDDWREEYDFVDNLKYSSYEGIYTSSDEYVLVTAGNHEDDYLHINDTVNTYDDEVVHIDDATYIEDLGEYVYDTDGYYQHNSDGCWYSYEEEEEESDEEVA